MLDFTEYAKIFISLFAILDPIGIIPMIIAFTAGITPLKRGRVGQIASVTVCGILLVALFVGEPMLNFFGISIHSFRAAGGILLLLMSIAMLQGSKGSQEGTPDSDRPSSVAIVPLSTPLLAGPGAISTVILDAQKGSGILHYSIMGLIIVMLSVIVWVTFLVAPWISRRLGTTGINIFTRLMGLVLASIAVEFIAGGIRGLFPALGASPLQSGWH